MLGKQTSGTVQNTFLSELWRIDGWRISMNKELLIEIMTSALNDDLCGGCSEFAAPYAYENGGSCQKCRSMAAEEIKIIIKKWKDDEHE